MELTTKRLVLSPITEADAQNVFTEFNEAVCKYMYPKPAENISETLDFIKKMKEKFAAGTDIVFVAKLKNTNEFIGLMGLHDCNTPTPTLGIWTKMDAHGYGYGKEGMHAVIEYALNLPTTEYLIYPVDRRNCPSRNIPQSKGGIIVDRYHEHSTSGFPLEIIEYRIHRGETPVAELKKPLIVFQGDSITDCDRKKMNPEDLGNGYVKMMATYFPDAIIRNQGISGHRSADILARWDEETLSIKPDMVCILMGINDIWHHYKFGKPLGKREFENNLKTILKKTIQALPDTKILLMDPFVYPIGEYESSWQKDLDSEISVVKELAREYADYYIPLQENFDTLAQSHAMSAILGDGVHPTEFGHKIIAEALLHSVSKFVTEFYEKQK